jgi:outer membrane protein
MKFIILIVALISTLMAEKLTLGVGPYMQTQPYKDLDALVVPSPVIFFDNSLIYVRWTRAGVYFLGDKSNELSWGFSLTAQPRVNQYKASDSHYLSGMSDRESSVEGGLAFSASKEKAYIEIIALTDVLARHDSWTLKTELGYEFEVADFTFYPSVMLTYQSSTFMDYYYGVAQSEATFSRAAYNAGSGMQYGAHTYIKYPLTDKLAAFGNIKVDKLPTEATHSPIVNEDYVYSGLVSLIYTFEY